MTKHITAHQLRFACSHYRDLFKSLFGKDGKVKVTEGNARALFPAFQFDWALENLLSPRQSAEFFKVSRNVLDTSTIYRNILNTLPVALRESSGLGAVRSALWHEAEGIRLRSLIPAFVAAYNGPRK